MESKTIDQKLDMVLAEVRDLKDAIHGSEAHEGIVRELRGLKRIVYGFDQDIGDHHRVQVMWRIHVWLLCTASAALGAILTLTVKWVVTFAKI